MALKIRLRRTGRRNAPSYRIVVAEASMPRDGRLVDSIGHYNPRTNPLTLVVDRSKALYWIEMGATPTETAKALLKRAGVFRPEEPGAVAAAAAAVAGAAKGAARKVAGGVAGAASAAGHAVAGAAAAVGHAVAESAAEAVEAVKEAVVEAVSGGEEEAVATEEPAVVSADPSAVTVEPAESVASAEPVAPAEPEPAESVASAEPAEPVAEEAGA